MEISTQVSLKTTYTMEKEHCTWLMTASMRESGPKVKCMAEESTHGQQARHTKVNIRWIPNMAKVSIDGKTAKCT